MATFCKLSLQINELRFLPPPVGEVGLGRDGKVRAVHAGFAAPASGEFHNELMQSITRTVETLLAESGSLASGTD